MTSGKLTKQELSFNLLV